MPAFEPCFAGIEPKSGFIEKVFFKSLKYKDLLLLLKFVDGRCAAPDIDRLGAFCARLVRENASCTLLATQTLYVLEVFFRHIL